MNNNIFITFIILGIIGYFFATPLIIITILGLCGYAYSKYASRKENYGGPIKNVRKIPITSCYKVCDNWAYNCEKDRPNNLGGCQLQREACKAECYYSNAQRL